jgi:hypothetical protein
MPGEKYHEGHFIWVSGYKESNYNIEWMRYEPECKLPEIVKTIPHVAFEMDDVRAAIKDKKVIIEPNSPSEGVLVAFIEENCAPIEFIQDKHLHGNKNEQVQAGTADN